MGASIHPSIDADHRLLSEVVGRFAEAVRSNNLPRAMLLFESLLTAVQTHFKREESLLAVVDGDLAEHSRLHEDVMRQLLSVRAEAFMLLRCWPDQAVDLVAAMLHHSLMHDQNCAAQFRNYADGELPPLTVAGLS